MLQHRWLVLLTVAFLAGVVFVLFWIRLQPIQIPETETSGVIPGSVANPTVTFVNPKKGAETPNLVIVGYSDFQCGPCAEFASTMDALLLAVPGVQYVWKNMPNESTHEFSTRAAIAAHCAGNQGKFWEYHDELFANQYYLTEGLFSQIAVNLGLDAQAFETCYGTAETLPLVKRDYEEGLALDITAVPTIFIGNERYTGALTFDDLFDRVEKALAE